MAGDEVGLAESVGGGVADGEAVGGRSLGDEAAGRELAGASGGEVAAESAIDAAGGGAATGGAVADSVDGAEVAGGAVADSAGSTGAGVEVAVADGAGNGGELAGEAVAADAWGESSDGEVAAGAIADAADGESTELTAEETGEAAATQANPARTKRTPPLIGPPPEKARLIGRARIRARRGRYRARRVASRHRTAVAVLTGLLGVLPATVGAGVVVGWVGRMPVVHSADVMPDQGYDPGIRGVAVDGRLPDAPAPVPLPAYDLPDGPLGIPATALAAYRHAGDVLGKEQPACHIDWALVASIGRIESDHARGGYVDAAGTTLQPILGPQLNGTGPFAAIPDTDHGVLDQDPVWDRAVGPFQFIPATWRTYAADGNGDGKADPGNLFDSSLAAARYLCSGGLDLANPDQLRTAIYRYNNSDAYVTTVILWAEAYRKGVAQVPDSPGPATASSAPPASPGERPRTTDLPPVATGGPSVTPTGLPPQNSPSGTPPGSTSGAPSTDSSTPTCGSSTSTTPTSTPPSTTSTCTSSSNGNPSSSATAPG
ncbi:lytic transglycosylase domain-containing protein [Amycolatopsis sp. VC5-11]|uniref:lytic transglycosylase domain-containing protein n=1 Tax=Amycolatopsis sp. VC5-11 TaxID=3120156 RepID=UPI00300B9A9F